MWLLIIGFGVGVFVGYKYPRQVEQVMSSIKNAATDLKDKFSKK
jgi:hypothetical protein